MRKDSIMRLLTAVRDAPDEHELPRRNYTSLRLADERVAERAQIAYEHRIANDDVYRKLIDDAIARAKVRSWQ
jgi:hypothetical protein